MIKKIEKIRWDYSQSLSWNYTGSRFTNFDVYVENDVQ